MIKDGEIIEAADHEKNVVSFLQGIYQATKISQDAGVTDQSYTYADSDVFSDSNGFNNTISTGDTTGDFTTDKYWGAVSAANESNSGSTSQAGGVGSYTLKKTITLASPKKVTQHANEIWRTGAGGSTDIFCRVEFVYEDATSDLSSAQSTSSGSAVPKTYTNPNPEKRVTDVKVYLQGGGQADQIANENNDVVTAYTFGDADVQTNSKTFSFNVGSILVTADKVLNGASTITIDVSTDGGSTFEKTGQALDEVIELDGDDADVVINFNLNVDGTDTPELYGYSFQVWP